MLSTSRLTLPSQHYGRALAVLAAVTLGTLALRSGDIRADIALLILLAAVVGLGKTSTA